MSERYQGGFVSLSFNPLGTQTSTNVYSLYTVGDNSQGESGLNNVTNYSSPKLVGSANTWKAVGAGYANSFGIKSDGSLWAWGFNNYGQLGDGTQVAKSSPIQVGSLTNWLKVAGSGYDGRFTGAIKTNGTLWVWGINSYGQLGQNDTAYKSSPVQVGTGTTWLNLAVGYNCILATKTDGTLWAWGRNNNGQLGLGNTTNKSSPTQVGALTTWSKVYAGFFSTYAIKTDGTLWSWGLNNSGQLGLGTSGGYTQSPQQVGALTTWSNSSPGKYYITSVKTDGTLWSWGLNQYGQLGLGNTTNYSSPKQVGALTDWLIACSGYESGSAVKSDGTLWTWGRSQYGVLGLGNTTNYSSPKQVGALTTWSIFVIAQTPHGIGLN